MNHASLNVANALGAWLGGLVIAAGYGYRAPALVGVALSVAGLLVILASAGLHVRGRRAVRPPPGSGQVADPLQVDLAEPARAQDRGPARDQHERAERHGGPAPGPLHGDQEQPDHGARAGSRRTPRSGTRPRRGRRSSRRPRRPASRPRSPSTPGAARAIRRKSANSRAAPSAARSRAAPSAASSSSTARTGYAGSTIAFGSRWTSRSMSARATATAAKARYAASSTGRSANRHPASANSSAGAGLHQRVARADREPAVVAAAAQDQPAEHRHVVAGADRRAAPRARRRRDHHRLPARHAVDHHVEEGPDHQAEHAGQAGDEGGRDVGHRCSDQLRTSTLRRPGSGRSGPLPQAVYGGSVIIARTVRACVPAAGAGGLLGAHVDLEVDDRHLVAQALAGHGHRDERIAELLGGLRLEVHPRGDQTPPEGDQRGVERAGVEVDVAVRREGRALHHEHAVEVAAGRVDDLVVLGRPQRRRRRRSPPA